MTSGPIKDVADVLPALHRAIADLTRAGIPVPAALYLAAVVLAFLERREPLTGDSNV
jgi:hypothetical protein